MPTIKEHKAKQFLENITKKDKVAIIHHDDGDGFCSGIILNNFCKSKQAKTKTFTFNNKNSTLKKLNLKKFNKIIVTDIPAQIIKPEIKLLANHKVLYIDHHEKISLPKNILYYPTVQKGYIPCSRTAYELTNQDQFLSLIGTISDSGDLYKENQTFIKNTLKQFKTPLEKFKTKYAHPFCNTIIHFKKSPQKAFRILSRISSPEQIKKIGRYSKKIENKIQKLVKTTKEKKETYKKINLYSFKKKDIGKEIAVAIISKELPGQIHIFISKQNKKYTQISARYQSPNANLPNLLKILTQNLRNSRSGGHPKASGGQIMTTDLEQFKQNIKDYTSDPKAKT